MVFPNLVVGIFILSNKKSRMGLDVDINHKAEISGYFEKSSFATLAVARTNLRDIRNRFINASNKYGNSVDYKWIKIKDQSVTELILKAFADKDKKKILGATLGKSRTPAQILGICEIPSTSGYRKIKSLILDGLLIPNGTFGDRNKRQVRGYISALENIKIDIDKGELIVEVKFTKM